LSFGQQAGAMRFGPGADMPAAYRREPRKRPKEARVRVHSVSGHMFGMPRREA